MPENFESLSNVVANEFLQSVVFIDDKAYSTVDDTDTNHDFDAKAIARAFADDQKICSIFQPEEESDIELFSDIAIKADVTVLDWQILIQQSPIASEEAADDEEDAEEDDIRGVYTKRIIKNLLCSPSKQNSLKLIVVYTGETDLSSIADDILNDLDVNSINGFSLSGDDNCCVISDSCKILVRAKSNGGIERGTHNADLRDREVPYQNLPAFINNEFAKMTNGLLPNFTLQALTVIRKNLFQILNIFSKNLDAAYLTHKALLPNIDDANELLVELLGDTFTSILRAENLNKNISEEVIELWIEQNIEDEDRFKLDKLGNPTEDVFTRDKDILKELLVSKKDVPKKYIDVLNTRGISGTRAKKTYHKYAFNLFHKDGEGEETNKAFSQLCHHKDLIKYDEHFPMLTLGSIVKSSLGDDIYYVCIQQRCDSVRVKEDEHRRFLFLTLTVVQEGKNFAFLTPDGQKLKLEGSTYNLRTIKFPGSECGTVNAINEDGSLYFHPSYLSEESPEKFEFVFELKDLYAQRVVAEYSANISRVGLDEPEWVRLSQPKD